MDSSYVPGNVSEHEAMQLLEEVNNYCPNFNGQVTTLFLNILQIIQKMERRILLRRVLNLIVISTANRKKYCELSMFIITDYYVHI